MAGGTTAAGSESAREPWQEEPAREAEAALQVEMIRGAIGNVDLLRRVGDAWEERESRTRQ